MLRNWSCIVVTCPTVSSVIATEKEICYMKRKGRISDDLHILTIEDPARNIGSGAATLNALLVATEHLSAKQNYMVISSDVLSKARILILHNGRDYVYSCTEKAFISLPLEYQPKSSQPKMFASGIVNNVESILFLIDEISRNSPPGVWVCSTDMMILKEQEANITIDWQNIADVAMFCVPSDLKYATGHGVVAIDEQGFISDIKYCGTEEQIKDLTLNNGKVPLVSGIVFMNSNVSESLLSLHVQAPLDSCTYLGLDSGAEPIQVSLFFDILVAMSSKISKESFIAGKCGKTYNLKTGINRSCSKENMLARSLVWDELSKYRMSAKILSGCQHLYWSVHDPAKYHLDNLFHIAKTQNVHSIFEVTRPLPQQFLTVNSYLTTLAGCEISSRNVIYDSFFEVYSLFIGENSFISGVTITNMESQLVIPPNCVVIRTFVKNPEREFIFVFGIDEKLTENIDISCSTFCNKPWEEHFRNLDITEDDIWPTNLDSKEKTLMNAKLFIPNQSLTDTLAQFFDCNSDINSMIIADSFKSSERYSLSDVLSQIDFSKVFAHKRDMYAKICTKIISQVLTNNEDKPLLPYFKTACAEEWQFTIMNVIDQVLLSDVNAVVQTRALSNMADLFGTMAGPIGVLRSGPGSNPSWNAGFALLKEGNILEGLETLKKERSNWLDRPDHIMRAARHYERAAQILIQRSVSTVIQNLHINAVTIPEIGVWITAKCPARIDMQGGWSDTPPICYELGGSVVNIAVLVDGVKPIGAKVCRSKEPVIVLRIGVHDMSREIKITEMREILNYDQPNAQGALLKASLVCADIVDIHSKQSLSEQLLSKFGGGFIVQSWSLLPHGCGMGASSILAGAIISTLWSASGKSFDKLSVVHAVLYVEQLLTTGGGWQDQVSGVLGGIQRGYSEAFLPLTVKSESILISSETLQKLNSHLLLVYTGKVRLAKNLLQNVVRNWYAREETVVTCFKNLIKHSHQMKEALENGDLSKVGTLMNIYWEQKKVLAPGCEPQIVKTIMELLKPVCYGQMLVGAGGGGFMCILTREPKAKESVNNILSNIMGNLKMSVHTVAIDSSGLEISIS